MATVDTHDVTINRRTTRGELVLSIRTNRVARAARVANFALEMGRPFSPEQRQSAEMQRAVREMHAQFLNRLADCSSDLTRWWPFQHKTSRYRSAAPPQYARSAYRRDHTVS